MNEMTLVDYSPEKAGVGGSTPSLATIIQSIYLTFEQEFSVRSQSASIRGMAENGNQHCPLDAIALYFTNNVIHLPSEY
jgi:hypothetical protein